MEVGNIYSWGSWETGWMGKEIIIEISKKHVHYMSVSEYEPKHSKEFVKINSKWMVYAYVGIHKCTHKKFEKKFNRDKEGDYAFKFVEKIKIPERILKRLLKTPSYESQYQKKQNN